MGGGIALQYINIPIPIDVDTGFYKLQIDTYDVIGNEADQVQIQFRVLE